MELARKASTPMRKIASSSAEGIGCELSSESMVDHRLRCSVRHSFDRSDGMAKSRREMAINNAGRPE